MVCHDNMEVFLEKPQDYQIDYAKRELGEDDERMVHVEGLLHQWISTVNYFPKNYDKSMVKNFLRFSKHDLERAKRKLESYYFMKKISPEIMLNRNPFSKEIDEAVKLVNFAMLPKLTEKGERLTVVRLRNSDPSLFEMNKICKLISMTYDLCLTIEHPVNTEILILDGTNFTPTHFAKAMPDLKRLINLVTEGYAIRLREIHIINGPSMMMNMLNAIKPILLPKLRNRFTIHKSQNTLLNHFSEKVLPKDYGGNLKSVNDYSDNWLNVLRSRADWFKNQESAIIYQSIPKVEERLCGFGESGVEGSFRKLAID